MTTALLACLLLQSTLLFGAAGRLPDVRPGMSAADVERVVRGVFPRDYVIVKIADYRVTQLDTGDAPDLLALVDMNGRGAGRLLVVTNEGPGLRSISLPVLWMSSLDNVLVDVDADGRREVVVRDFLTPYGGEFPTVTFARIYKVTVLGFVDVSAKAQQFYAGELERVNGQLRGELVPEQRATLVAERDKILRMTGRNQAAGLIAAERWSRDADPRMRVLAAAVLGDIGDARAKKTLDKLARDPVPLVAATARRSRSRHR